MISLEYLINLLELVLEIIFIIEPLSYPRFLFKEYY